MQNNVLSVIKMEMGQFYLCLLSACNSTFTFRDVTEQLIRPIIRTKPFYDKNIRCFESGKKQIEENKPHDQKFMTIQNFEAFHQKISLC